ncbi:hypothetical protein ACW7G2_05185 [Luteimonas sp. A277]
MKPSQDIRSLRIAILAALAIPFAALAQPAPTEPPVDPITPVDTTPPEAVPPTDPVEAAPPWTDETQPPPATPPAQSDTTSHVLGNEQGRDVTLHEHPPSSVVGDYSVDFDTLDTDSDGHISRSEAQANPTLSAEFDGVDRDGDGLLSREELAGWNR